MNKTIIILSFFSSSLLLSMEPASMSPEEMLLGLASTQLQQHNLTTDKELEQLTTRFNNFSHKLFKQPPVTIQTLQYERSYLLSTVPPQDTMYFICNTPGCKKAFAYKNSLINHIYGAHPEYNTSLKEIML